MSDPPGCTIDELGPDSRERAVAWAREQGRDRAAAEIRTALRARGFQAARLEIEVETPGEPDGVAFYGRIGLGRVARNDPAIRKRVRLILRHGFAIAAQVGFIAKVGNYYRAPTSMSVHVRADPVSEEGEIESAWPYEPDRPEVVNRAVCSLERRLQKMARAAARDMLPLARSWLGREAAVDRLRKNQVRFTAEGEPLPPAS
jgi:hypothetical protein